MRKQLVNGKWEELSDDNWYSGSAEYDEMGVITEYADDNFPQDTSKYEGGRPDSPTSPIIIIMVAVIIILAFVYNVLPYL